MPESVLSQTVRGTGSPWSENAPDYVLGKNQEGAGVGISVFATVSGSEATPIHKLHSGDTGDSSMNDREDGPNEVTLRLIKAELDAGLARIRATESDIRVDLSKMPTRYEFYGLAVAIVGILLSVLMWGGDRFDGGVQVATSVAQQTIEAQQLANKNAEQIETLIERTNRSDTQIEAIYRALVGTGAVRIPDDQNE